MTYKMDYIYQSISKKNGSLLRGVINTPDDFDTSKKYPAVIFYHGFGGDRNGRSFFRSQNAKYLTDRGYICVRFDFEGSGESDGSFYDMTVSREEEDAMMVYDFTKIKSFVDKERIYILGHSLGGVIASLIGSKTKAKKMCLLAPASDMNNRDYLKVMAQSLFLEKFEKLKSEDEPSIREVLSDIEDLDIGGLRLHKNFLIDFFKKDVYKSARAYKGKVLILRGDADELVFDDSNVKLNQAFSNSRYELIRGADHDFTNLKIRKEVFEKMYRFFEA
ncbi:MAG: alpha/beta fold hydrolase [Anaerococcus sp.]|nr:alpha/beta fold hydrolase [Anaerococcus sp.]